MVPGFYTNTMPLYIKDLSMLTFWFLWGILKSITLQYPGVTIYLLQMWRVIHIFPIHGYIQINCNICYRM